MEIKDIKLNWFYLLGFLLIVALPLLNLPPWFSPAQWGKVIVFRIILTIIIFLFIWQILSRREITSIKFSEGAKIIFFLLLALLGIFFLATLFSLDPRFSFWGSPDRAGGFLNFVFYLIFAILAFLTLKQREWQKLWDFALIVGVLVSIFAILQQFGLVGKILIPFEARPPSTLGNPTFLALYLLLSVFLSLSFGMKERDVLKKFFYFLSLFLFLFVIFLTFTRGAYLGLLIGSLYFLFFYQKKIIWLKVTIFILLILGIYGIYFINSASEFPQFIKDNTILAGAAQRFLIKNFPQEPMFSGWKVSWQALKSRPILGYGPENFSIGFDKFYDASLPGIEIRPKGNLSWWDRAHNFCLDIAVTAGLPALIIYLVFFGFLFWQLQKLKKRQQSEDEKLITHGIQATFIAYLTANFFSFDTFPSYLISSLLIAYSLNLISDVKHQPEKIQQIEKTFLLQLQKYRKLIISLIFIIFIWFIWVFNLKPLYINAEINKAKSLSQGGGCEKAIYKMEKILPKRSFLDAYLRLNYSELLLDCAARTKMPQISLELFKRGHQILKENIEIRPYNTWNWLLLENFTNSLIEREQNLEKIEELKREANYYFEKASQLSPKRQEILIEGIKTDLLTREYQKAKEKSQKCISWNPKTGACYWLMGLTNIYLGENKMAEENINIAATKGYPINSEGSLLALSKVYADTRNYQKAIKIYSELARNKPKEAIYHLYLALIYREMGDFQNAKKEALILWELSPENRDEIESFLKTLE